MGWLENKGHRVFGHWCHIQLLGITAIHPWTLNRDNVSYL